MDTAGGAVTVPSIVAANRTSSSSNVIINANQSNNNGVGSGGGGTLIHSNIISNSSSNSSLISSNGGGGGSGGGNSSSSSSSTSSNSSGYGSTSATPTNSYETLAAASTTPVAIAEPIIPIATVAAVSPFYSEAITSQVHESQHYSAHQQQHSTHSSHLQHQHLQLQQQQPLQQTHQHQQLGQSLPHSQRQEQYFSSYDYQHQQQQSQQSQQSPPLTQDQQQLPPHQLQQQQTHNTSPNYQQLGGSGSGSFDAAASNSPVSGLGAYQQTMVHPYKASGVAAINYERHNRSLASSGSSRTAGYPPNLQNEATAGKSINHSQYLGIDHGSATSSSKSRSSTSLLGASLSSTPTTTKPQATATPFYAQPLSQQQSGNTTSYYEQLKHKVPLDYHENYGNFPNAAAAAAYHQHQKYYAAAKSQLKDAYGAPQSLASGKSLYHNSNNFYAGASAQHTTAAYDKYMYPSTAYPTMGGYETSPADAAYRKASAASAATLNSSTWPWGIEYASGNSRTIPPPTGHLPTATVAPTHASYLAANSSHLSARDPYYMSHDKYGMKYDKYPPSYQQTAYVSPPSARHHLWPTTHNALNERLSAPAATHAPHAPHALHAGTPYFPSNAPPAAINARQSCCTQPYAAQNCYYQPPPPGRITHGQPVTPMVGQASSYMPAQSASSHHQTHLNPLSSSCKYGGSGGLEYGTGNKLKPPNDLYLSSHYENSNGPTAPPPTHYPYGSAANNQLYSSNQMHHGQQPAGPLIARDPSLANSATFSNDLTYDTYLHESAAHLNAHSMGGIPPGGGPTAAKRALLDYRKPQQQPPPPTTAQVRVDTYDQHNRSELHYRDSTELLNTPETTTTAFNVYDSQSQASVYTTEETAESQHKSGEEANKNLSLRDFIANWNDDEEDYTTAATNEVMAFDQQSSVINEVLQHTSTVSPASNMEQIPALIPDKPCVTEVTEITKPLASSPTPPPAPLSEMDTSQYTTNLPDIIIDIEKSNVNTSLTTPPNAPAIVDASSLSLDNFDVEKELDQLQQMQRKTELDSVIVKDDSSRTDIKPNKAHESDSHQSKNLTTQISFDDLNLESTKAAIPTARSHLSNDMEGYDSGSSRHSNESSLFEKEYETFITKISSNNEHLTKAEKEIEQKVQDFSKFYKRKRKLKDEELKSPQAATLERETKKLKSSDEEEVNDSNFPRVYTKKSRNRPEVGTVKRLKPQRQLRRRKPTSLYYKKVHSLRRFRLQRDKQVRDSSDELKEKHLPLIKRQSIKNYSLTSRSSANLFNPLPLKTLVLTVINSEEFRGRIMKVMVVESQPEVEEKHICVDPSCETCDVIRSLMEPEAVEATLEPNDIIIPNTAEIILSEIQTDDSAEQGQIVLVQEIEGDPKNLFSTGSNLPEKAEIESAIIIKGADVPIVVENKLEYEVLNLQTTKTLSSGVIIKSDVYEEPLESSAKTVDLTPQYVSNPQACKEMSPSSSELVTNVETVGELAEISTQEVTQTSKELPPLSSELVTAVETLAELETEISPQDLSNPSLAAVETLGELETEISTQSSSELETAVNSLEELATEMSQTEQMEVQNANVNLKLTEEVELQTPKQVDSPRATSVIRKHESNSVERDVEIQAKKKCIEQESSVTNDTKEASSDPQIVCNPPTIKLEAVQKTTVICKIKSIAKDIDEESEDVEPNLQSKAEIETDVTDMTQEQQLVQKLESLEDKSVTTPSTITPNEAPVVQITTVIRKHETKSKELDFVEPPKDSNAKTALPSSLNTKLQPDDDTDSSESETCSSSCSSSDNSDEDEDKDGEDSQDSSDSSDSESDSDSDIENETLKTLIKVVEKCEKLSKSSREAQNTDDVIFCEIQDGNTQDSFQPISDIKGISATTKAECKTKENLDKGVFESPKEKQTFSPAGIASSTNVELESDNVNRSASETELLPKETDCSATQRLHSSAETLLDKVSSDISGENFQVENKTINVETIFQSSENMKTSPDHAKQIEQFPTEKTLVNMEREQETVQVVENISEKSENELRKLSVDENIEELSSHSYTKNDSDDENVEQSTAQIPSHNISPAKNITDDEYMDTLFPEGPIKIVSNEDVDTQCTQTEIQAYTQTEDADFKVLSPESPIKSIEKLSPDSPAENISDEEISAHTSKNVASYMPEETTSSISAYTPKGSLSYTPEDTSSSISAYTPKNRESYTPEKTRCSSVISQGRTDAKTKSTKFVYGPKEDFIDLSEDTSSAEDSEQDDPDKELPEDPTMSPLNEEFSQVVDITEDTTSEEECDSDEADKTYTYLSKSTRPNKATNISDETRSSVGTNSCDSVFDDENRHLSTTLQATRIPVIAPRPAEIQNSDLVHQDEIETSNLGDSSIQREDSRSSYDNNLKSNIYKSVIKSIEDVQRESESEQSSLSSHPLTPVPCVEENSQDLTESYISQAEAILMQPSEENLSHSSAEDIRPTVEFHSVIREAMGSQEICAPLSSPGSSEAILMEGIRSPVEFHSVIRETSVSHEVSLKLSGPERSDSILPKDQEDLKTSNKFPENSLEDETNKAIADTGEEDYSIPSKELHGVAMQTEDTVHKDIPNLEEDDSILAEESHSAPSMAADITVNISEAQKTTNKSEAEHISIENKEIPTEESDTATTLLECTSNFERLEKVSNDICLNSESSVTEPNECDSEYSITSPDFYEDSTSSEDTKTEESAAELPESMEDSLYKEIPEEVSTPVATDITETSQTTSSDQKFQVHKENIKQFTSFVEDEHFPLNQPPFVEEDYDNEVLDLSKDSKIFTDLKNDNSICTDVEQSSTGFLETQLSPCITPPTPTIVYSLNESPTDIPKSPVKEDPLQKDADNHSENETSRDIVESGTIIVAQFKNEELAKCAVEKDDSTSTDLAEEVEASVATSESISKDVLRSSAVKETITSTTETLVANFESEIKDVLPSPEIEESIRSPKENAQQSVAIEESLQSPEENHPEYQTVGESLDSNTRQSPTTEEPDESLKENATELSKGESCKSSKESPIIEESLNSSTPQAEPSESLKESLTESIKESPSEALEKSVTESIEESPSESLEVVGSPSLDVITEESCESPKENAPENPTIIESLHSDVLQTPTIKELCEAPIEGSNESNNAAILPESKTPDGISLRETSSPIAEIEKTCVPQNAESPLDKEPNTVVEHATQSLPIETLMTAVQSKETASADNHSSISPDQERSKECSDHSNSSSADESLNKSSVRPRSREPSPEMNFWNTKGKYRAWRTYQSDASKSPTSNVPNDGSRAGSSGIPTPEPLEGTTGNETTVADDLEHRTQQAVVTRYNSQVTSPREDTTLSSATITDKTNDELSADFHGFKIQSSFDDGSDFNGFEDQHEEERIRREIENLNEDSAANDAFLYDASTRTTRILRKSPSKSPELDELEALEKELSQQCLAKELHDETTSAVRHKNDVELETETQLVSVSNVIISTNDIEHIKKMLESDEEHPNDEELDLINEVKVPKAEKQEGPKENVSSTNICVIPKLSDLCRAALNSSLNVNKLTIVQSNRKEAEKASEETISENPNSTTSTPKKEPYSNSSLMVERELSVEEALAEMYRQAGVLLSDPEDNDSGKTTPAPTINATAATTTEAAAAAAKNEEAQDVLLINLHEILNSDNDVFVLQCDMNVNDLGRNDNDNANDVANPLANGNAAPPTERVHNLQLIGIVNRDSESSEIHIISSDSESEVIILSDCDTDVEFQPPPPPMRISPRPSPREYIPFINDLEDTSDSLSDLSTIHHEEIVPENLHKFLQEEFYKYLHEKYAQKKLSKYYHANRVLRKYKRNRVAHKYRP